MKTTRIGNGTRARILLALAGLIAATAVVAETKSERDQGLLVLRVLPDSPAERAGVLRGDILVAIDGKSVDGPAALRDILAEKKAGQSIELSLLRGESSVAKSLTIEDRLFKPTLGLAFAPEGGIMMDMQPGMGRLPLPQDLPRLGEGAQKKILRFAGPLGLGQAAVVVEVVDGSPADEAGIVPGDRIEAVDGAPLKDGDLVSAIKARKPGDAVELTVVRAKGKEKTVKVVLGESPEAKGSAYLGLRYSAGLSAQRERIEKIEKFEKQEDDEAPDAQSGATEGNWNG
ncbi:MAG: PDZ domain-containing protein [Spirochaetaceae bacterium]|nr:PDZ domain-containing protein [Spirochaetaceae bacterium]